VALVLTRRINVIGSQRSRPSDDPTQMASRGHSDGIDRPTLDE